jgi:hypothetical protein
MQETKEDLKWYQEYRKQVLGLMQEFNRPKKKFFNKKKKFDKKKTLV